jgi:hypothetical protein
VLATDLLAELARRGGADRAEALARFVLLRPRRARRLRLDDRLLDAEAEAFAVVAAAAATARSHRAVPASPPGGGDGFPAGAEAPVRTLLIELDRAPAAVDRATRTADPACLVATLRSVATATMAAAPHVPAGDPLWPAVARVLDTLAQLVTTEPIPESQGRLP